MDFNVESGASYTILTKNTEIYYKTCPIELFQGYFQQKIFIAIRNCSANNSVSIKYII